MIEDRVLERSLALVQMLHGRTREGKVVWRSAKSPDAFETDLEEDTLRIRIIPDEDFPNDPNVALDVVDRASARLISTISNVTLRPVLDRKTREGLSPYALLAETYEMARRKALKVDDVLGRVLESLRRQ